MVTFEKKLYIHLGVSADTLKLNGFFYTKIMAKELPYFKFEPSEWLEGEIQVCSDTAIVCFTNLCSGYWLKLGCISYAFALHKYCRKDASIMQELIDNGIIQLVDDEIRINFLDTQFKEFKGISDKRSKAANKRWKNNTDNEQVNANALQSVSKSNAIREDKIREDKIKEYKSIEDRKMEFKNSLLPFLNNYSKDLLNNFFKYWTEHGIKDKKMRFEKEKSFGISRRLETWKKNELKFDNNKKEKKQTGAEAFKNLVYESINKIH